MTESRSSERTPVHYTMKTPSTARPSGGPRSSYGRAHSRSSSHAKRSGQGSKPSTPTASPRMPFSVGQAYPPPPRLSPGRVADARATSPNYFGMAPTESAADGRDSSLLPRDNWSPPTSSVKSFTAALPRQMTIDANPDFEAFKRQADLNRGESFFNLSSSHFGAPSTPGNGDAAAPTRPRPPLRWHTHASDSMPETTASRPTRERPASRMDVDQDGVHDSAYVSSDSRRDTEASAQPPMTLNMPRYESPRQSESPFEQRTMLSAVEDRHPRLSIPNNRPVLPPPSVLGRSHQRAETLPADMESGPSLISPSHLKSLLESNTRDTDLLLLDLRVSQQYLQARVEGALNLCTPTTLLKRATFNLTKLQQTFQNPEDKEQFSKWASTQNLVVYDSHSSEKRDAMSCSNMIKKFVAEGYKGGMFILRGGFNAFSAAYPEFVEDGAPTGAAGSGTLGGSGGSKPGILPVIGGVMLPNASNNPNPFFSNIRQNMDLADGVGQLDIARPNGLESPSLPRWLRDASTTSDHGKQVSDKFLHIEKDEQSRMRKAYSVFNPESESMGKIQVQLSGIEKGVKNRYKDILPFDHSRVKLLGRDTGACDYVNASHIKASRSNKRYIASQGPLPATFEDFWSVIWDQDIRVIVMLTAESEGGQLKCHPYWKGNEFGHTKLRLLSEKKVSLDIDKHRSNSHAPAAAQPSTEFGRKRANTTTSTTSLEGAPPTQATTTPSESPYVIVRKFAMSHAAHPFAPIREITHLHYPSWPDFGVPAQPSHLLGLVELANVMQRAALPVDTPSVTGPRTSPDPPMAWYDEPEADARARPMLVHCSAGCGRTGTFCTVDSVIDMLKRQRLTRTTLKPVRKRDSDGDIKMSGERQVEEAVSPKTAREKAFSFATSPRKPSRLSPETSQTGRESPPPLNTAWVSDDTIDLIAETVEDFRSQRLSMVQSLRQFVLCYETILEYMYRLHERSGVGATTGMTSRARSGSLQHRRNS